MNIAGIILPRKFILQLDRILGDFEGKVKMICTDTQVSLEADNFIIISKLIDGHFLIMKKSFLFQMINYFK